MKSALSGLALAMVLLTACSPADPPIEARAPLVEVAPVRRIDLLERIEASGELLAIEEATVAAELPGRVTEILRPEGSAVAEGDVILRIDPERRELELADARARLGEGQAALRESERELRRLRQLHERGAASDAMLDAADTAHRATRARVRALEAKVGVAERALRDAEVRAPFAGLVARRYVSRGEYVNAGAPLIELVATDPVEVEFHLPERDAARVRQGQPVEVRVAPLPEEIFRANVSMVAPTIDPRTRTLRVKGLIENTEGRLKPGLFARVDLGIDRRQGVLVVPEEAVLQRADGAIVFALDGGDRVRRVRVETGVHRDGEVELRSGLEAPAEVVVRGQARLSDGLVVRTRSPDATATAPPGESEP